MLWYPTMFQSNVSKKCRWVPFGVTYGYRESQGLSQRTLRHSDPIDTCNTALRFPQCFLSRLDHRSSILRLHRIYHIAQQLRRVSVQ